MADSEISANYFDGASNRKRSATVQLGAQLMIREGGALLAVWPYDAIRRADGGATGLRLRSVTAPELARLDIADRDDAARLAALCPRLDETAASGISTRRILAWSSAAAASILLVAAYGLPVIADRLAPLVPVSWEARIGDVVDAQVKTIFGAKTCVGRDGEAALSRLVGRLGRAAGIDAPLRASVIDSGIANAMALPGGRVYVFRGLLDRAETPDELAGVIAHELGHVGARDGMRKLIQSGGSSYLLGLLFGDVAGSGAAVLITRELLDSAYSREAETRADDFAAEALARLGRPPEPFGELLLRITGEKKATAMSVVASHPVGAERLERLRAHTIAAKGPELLSFGDWRALKAICSIANAEPPPARRTQ